MPAKKKKEAEAEAASPKVSPKASPKASPKVVPQGSPPSDIGLEAKITDVGDQIRVLKEKLKGQGLSGKKVNDHDEVKALVAQLQELKSSDASPVPPVAAPVAAPVEAEKKEKKPRPAPPPPPPALATASLLVRAAAAQVFGLRPGAGGQAELQPLWVTEPGYAKLTISIEKCARSPFPKDEAFDALLDAIEAAANRLVKGNAVVSLAQLGRDAAAKRYGDVLGEPSPAEGELQLAHVQGSILAEVPTNWALCGKAGACGEITFDGRDVEAGSKKKPETMILAKKRLMVRFRVACPDAVASAGSGEAPSAAEVKGFAQAEVRVLVPGLDAGAEGGAPTKAGGPKAQAKGAAAAVSAGPNPVFPYKAGAAAGGSKDDAAAAYWLWFGRALGKRLRDAAVAADCSKADVLSDPTVAGLKEACARFGRPLSETEVAHLQHVPMSAEWLASIMKDQDFGDADAAEEEFEVDPWKVVGVIDYRKLVEKFGSTEISPELLQRIERLTVGKGNVKELHPWLRRGIFFSHRDMNLICDCAEKGKPFYLYTGRGPSSLAMHLGHLIPFMMTKWLQDAFNVPLVIQMTDDEKFLWKGEYNAESGEDNLMQFRHFTTENVKDIIAVGFDKKKTFIFSDLEYVGHMYPNIVRIWKAVTYNTARSAFGFVGESNIGQSGFPAVQAAPSFPTSFPVVLGGQNDMCCLIPCAIDQDPYFRITRDVAHKLVPASHPLKGKPALLHAKFFPPLQGASGKMNASDATSAIFLTDTQDEICSKIKTHAFSGGQATAKEQREKGANLDVDVSYQWLRFFLHDDVELDKIASDYGSGQGEFWSTGTVKDRLVKELQEIVGKHQQRRVNVSDEEVEEWMEIRKLQF